MTAMNVNEAAAASSSSPLAAYTTPRNRAAQDETEDRFLALLVSQLQNQDPLNPLQNSEITSQLAQINTVKGLDKLAGLLQSLVGQTEANESLQAANLVGRRVLVAGDTLALAGGSAEAGFELDRPVDKLRVTIRDGAGAVLSTVDLGAKAAGLHTFAWDGTTDAGVSAAEGVYRFEIEASANGANVQPNALALARVDGVVPGKDGPTLRLGGLPPVQVSQVKQIL
jgi:flagellar basal-body rod modification protein FlgD